MTEWPRVPGYVSHTDGPEMPTVTIETEQIRKACEHARDELGFDVCVDVVATDYLGWGSKGVSGYIGTSSGRDLMHPMTQGLQVLPVREDCILPRLVRALRLRLVGRVELLVQLRREKLHGGAQTAFRFGVS